MNKKQRIVLKIGLLLVILNGLFPPFEGKFSGSDSSAKNLGYHFIFNPPTKEWGYSGFEVVQRQLPINSHVISSIFFIQFVTIIGATIGALFLFRKEKSCE